MNESGPVPGPAFAPASGSSGSLGSPASWGERAHAVLRTVGWGVESAAEWAQRFLVLAMLAGLVAVVWSMYAMWQSATAGAGRPGAAGAAGPPSHHVCAHCRRRFACRQTAVDLKATAVPPSNTTATATERSAANPTAGRAVSSPGPGVGARNVSGSGVGARSASASGVSGADAGGVQPKRTTHGGRRPANRSLTGFKRRTVNLGGLPIEVAETTGAYDCCQTPDAAHFCSFACYGRLVKLDSGASTATATGARAPGRIANVARHSKLLKPHAPHNPNQTQTHPPRA